jgi:hypothetical protein
MTETLLLMSTGTIESLAGVCPETPSVLVLGLG